MQLWFVGCGAFRFDSSISMIPAVALKYEILPKVTPFVFLGKLLAIFQ